MLRVYEGSSEAFGQERGQEVLYENTGYSKYFASTFSYDISQFQSWSDFERIPIEELNADRGHVRINRVYRQLVTSPAMYWDNNEDVDSLYLKNQRQWVAKNLEEQLGGRLDIHKNMACWMVEEMDCYGKVHPRDAMLPEIVLLVCNEIQQRLEQHRIVKMENECIDLKKGAFEELIWECREKWNTGWSKEYREMPRERFIKAVLEYMRDWMIIRESADKVSVLPGAGKTTGYYPADFKGEADE